MSIGPTDNRPRRSTEQAAAAGMPEFDGDFDNGQPTIGDDLRRALAAGAVVMTILIGAALLTGLAAGALGVDGATISNRAQWLALLVFQSALVALVIVFARLFGPLRQVFLLLPPRDGVKGLALPVLVTIVIMGVFSTVSGLAFPDAMRQDLAVFQKLLEGSHSGCLRWFSAWGRRYRRNWFSGAFCWVSWQELGLVLRARHWLRLQRGPRSTSSTP